MPCLDDCCRPPARHHLQPSTRHSCLRARCTKAHCGPQWQLRGMTQAALLCAPQQAWHSTVQHGRHGSRLLAQIPRLSTRYRATVTYTLQELTAGRTHLFGFHRCVAAEQQWLNPALLGQLQEGCGRAHGQPLDAPFKLILSAPGCCFGVGLNSCCPDLELPIPLVLSCQHDKRQVPPAVDMAAVCR